MNANTSVILATFVNNVEIKPGQTFKYCYTGDIGSYYSYGVEGTTKGVLSLTQGWYDNGNIKGPHGIVKNIGDQTVTYNLKVMAVAESEGTQLDASKLVKLDN